MGLFTQFSNDLSQYAERQIKFKQGKLSDAAWEKDLISDDLLLAIDDGACAAYVCMWIRSKLDPSDKTNAWTKIGPGRDRLTKLKSANDAAGLGIVQAAAPSFAQYTERIDLKEWNSIHKLGKDFKVYISRDDDPIDKDDIVSLGTALLSKDDVGEDGGCFYISAGVKDSTSSNHVGRHALGFFNDNNKNFYFFDPNVGEYKLKTSYKEQSKGFFQRYHTLIVDKFKWKFYDLSAYFCSDLTLF